MNWFDRERTRLRVTTPDEPGPSPLLSEDPERGLVSPNIRQAATTEDSS